MLFAGTAPYDQNYVAQDYAAMMGDMDPMMGDMYDDTGATGGMSGGDMGGMSACESAGGTEGWKNDGMCDSNNNIPECDYDGDDCGSSSSGTTTGDTTATTTGDSSAAGTVTTGGVCVTDAVCIMSSDACQPAGESKQCTDVSSDTTTGDSDLFLEWPRPVSQVPT